MQTVAYNIRLTTIAYFTLSMCLYAFLLYYFALSDASVIISVVYYL